MKAKCPYCNCAKLVKAGLDYQKGGVKQRYQCRKCRKVTIKPIMENLLEKEGAFQSNGIKTE